MRNTPSSTSTKKRYITTTIRRLRASGVFLLTVPFKYVLVCNFYLFIFIISQTTPIPYPKPPPSHLPTNYGSYHQIYRLDGRLVAIGVLDILPACVSSVYFIYDNDWEEFSLGKVAELPALVADID